MSNGMTDDERASLVAALRDPVAESLADLYACSRVWEAWQYGTMTVEDFASAAEDEAVIENVIEAVLPTFLAKIEADGKRLALAEKTIADAATALDVRGIPFGADMLAVWDRHIAEAKATLRNYDAAKEAL